MSDFTPDSLLVYSVAFAFIGALFQSLWQDLKGRTLPIIEFRPTSDCDAEEKLRQPKRNFRERLNHMVLLALLGAFFGALSALYFLGFKPGNEIPNQYGVAFVSLVIGYLVVQISTFLEKVDLARFVGPK